MIVASQLAVDGWNGLETENMKSYDLHQRLPTCQVHPETNTRATWSI